MWVCNFEDGARVQLTFTSPLLCLAGPEYRRPADVDRRKEYRRQKEDENISENGQCTEHGLRTQHRPAVPEFRRTCIPKSPMVIRTNHSAVRETRMSTQGRDRAQLKSLWRKRKCSFIGRLSRAECEISERNYSACDIGD